MEIGQSEPDRFEAVYYSYAVPRSAEILTILGLVFDRIHFPGVYMPPPGFDEDEVEREFQRIANLQKANDPSTQQLLACMAYAVQQKYLSEFCVFQGIDGKSLGSFPNEVHGIVDTLENTLFGPRPEGEIPMRSVGPWIKGFPGEEKDARYVLSAPDTITYPANALVYAAKNHLPLINDQEWLPVPGIATDAKSNAKILAIILAMESVRLVLPNLKPLHPAALKDLREEIRSDVRPFRLAMLRLASELNAVISAGAPIEVIQKEAKFLAETKIYPELHHLEGVLNNPTKHWYRKAADFAKAAPQLAMNFFTLPREMALAQLIASLAGLLSQVRDDQVSAERDVMRSGLNFLLKLNKN